MIYLLKKVLLDWIIRLKGNSRRISGNWMSGPEQGSRRCLKEQAVVRVHLLRRLCCRRGWGFRGQLTNNAEPSLQEITYKQRQFNVKWEHDSALKGTSAGAKFAALSLVNSRAPWSTLVSSGFRSACAVAAVVTLSLINLAIIRDL